MASIDYIMSVPIYGGRRKIIYVDDTNYSLISFKKGLEKYYEIFLADSSVQMYKILENIKPDIILLDVNMPEKSGCDIIKELKTDERYCEIPVIFLTSSIERENVVKGLGLGAADYIVKPFDAKKVIESIENQFNPKKPRKDKSDEKDQSSSMQDDSAAVQNSAAAHRTPNILVVDDIPSMLRTIHFSLSGKYNVSLLSKSEVVVEFLKNNKIDLILMDYLMPGLSGIDLIPMIKALPDYIDVPIIIITTEGTLKNVSDALSCGACDFIVKPFDPKELNYKVDRQIRLYRESKERAEKPAGFH